MHLSQNKHRNLLILGKKDLESKLLLAAPDLTREYLSLCSALEAMDKADANYVVDAHAYAAHRKATGAIEEHLEKVERFLADEELIEALLSGGWDGKNDEYARRRNIKDSLRHNLKDTDKSGNPVNPLLVRVDKKIGLAKWIDIESTQNKK
jgi:hypothetical protein